MCTWWRTSTPKQTLDLLRTSEFLYKTLKIGEETHYDVRKSPRNKASKRQKLVFQCFLLTSANTKEFQDGE